jgi:PAS domain S-box-containing protein
LDQVVSRAEHLPSRYRDLVELASDGIFVADLEGRYQEVNDAGCRMLGYSREEILGKTIMDLILPEDKERLFNHRERFIKGGTDVSEWMLLKKDGTYLPVEVSAKILPDSRWLGIARDMSERKRTEEKLRQTQERFDLAIKGADLATWDWNVTTGEVVSNPRCAQMRGYEPNELSPRVDAYIASIHPDDLPAFQKAVRECLEDARPDFECEYRASTKSGDWVWTLSKGRVFERNERGEPARIVGTALDITSRKRAEDALRLSEATAKRATQARDDMLGVIAHDLRSPLMTIRALATVLQKTGSEQEIGNEIEQATRRMSRLIRDLVDATQLEAGRFTINQERVPTCDVLSHVLNSQTPLTFSASLELSLDAVQELPDVWADRDRLLQVFENLVGNATKFTKPRGRVVVGARAGAGEVLFSVSDTGCGIENDQLASVFDRFWQTPEARRNGVGLGLPIVKGIIDAHGGRVWVQSSPGRGSTFSFTIPVATEAPS